jgi:hypothetical protein
VQLPIGRRWRLIWLAAFRRAAASARGFVRSHGGEHDEDNPSQPAHDGHREPLQELAGADGHCGDRPESEARADRNLERRVIVRRQGGGDDLGEVAPLSQEDHDEGGRDGSPCVADPRCPLSRGGLRGHAVAKREDRATQEQHRDDRLDETVRQDGVHRRADRHRDRDVDREGERGPRPHGTRPAARPHQQRGEHGEPHWVSWRLE